jgi:5-formyltetrahydrofolate cyclo-ligase
LTREPLPASPPSAADAVPAPPGSRDWEEIRRWRTTVRRGLIARRQALDDAARTARSERALRRLRATVDLRRFPTLGLYWPVRGEIDIRELALAHHASGGCVALPVIATESAPVQFWRWEPGAPLAQGRWNIPVPARREVVTPDALIAPLVGFDSQRFRLGYGSGYYDRTLAAARPRPFCVGLGYELGRLDSILPQPHDIAMDLIVTDA